MHQLLWNMPIHHSTPNVIHTLGQIELKLYAQILHQCVGKNVGKPNKSQSISYVVHYYVSTYNYGCHHTYKT
jgi:hypothetical protein